MFEARHRTDEGIDVLGDEVAGERGKCIVDGFEFEFEFGAFPIGLASDEVVEDITFGGVASAERGSLVEALDDGL